MNSTDRILITLALGAIAILVVLVTWLKVNPFLALSVASLAVGAGAVGMSAMGHSPGRALTMYTIVGDFGAGMGRTLGSVAAVIGLGAMLGRLLEASGGARVLAHRCAAYFGPRRAVACIMVLAIAVGLPTWFAVGLLILLPVMLRLAKEAGRPFLTLGLPMLACLSVMHGLTPPHPGPVAALAALEAHRPNVGLVLFWGFVVGIPTAVVAGPMLARSVVPRIAAEAPKFEDKAGSDAPTPPSVGMTVFSMLLPVLLMLLDTVAQLVGAGWGPVASVMRFIGHPLIAMLVSVLFATWSLGVRCGFPVARVLAITERSVAEVGMVLLVVGGGGGFAAVLQSAGIGPALGELALTLAVPPLLLGWMVAAFIRVAVGSATVAITTAAGLLAPVLAVRPVAHVELLIVAMGFGSLFLSHLNDSGFWIVKESLGLSAARTLRSWSVSSVIVGVLGLGLTWLLHVVLTATT